MKKFLKFLKWTGIAAFWAVIAGVALLAVLIMLYGNDLPDYKKLAIYAPPVATRLYASDGSLLIEYADERRVFIDYSDMPPMLVNAFVAAEDQNFWTHPGIDPIGIARAGINNVRHALGLGSRFTGASTITQQVAKNFFLSSERTLSRKIKEAILALKLERAFSKEHIMTLYLNQIFLGARAYGVGAASLMYFNKPVSELSLSQMAFLASLPKAPNNRARAVERRNYVLNRMVTEKYITRADADAAAADPLNINTGFTDQMDDDFQYFSEDVRRDLLNKLGREELYNDGLYVKTTIVPNVQKAAAAALKATLDSYNAGRTVPAQGAVIILNPHTGRVLAMTGGYSFSESGFNRATQAVRQIGSTIKPFVYLAALETNKYSPATLLLDAPIVGWRENGALWKPENFDRKFLGLIPLRLSLEQSRNVPTVRMVEDIGIATALAPAMAFGVYPDDMTNLNLSMALGSGETTLAKLALGYAAFVNGGHKNKLTLIDYVQDRYGKTIVGSDNNSPASETWSPDSQPPAPKPAGPALADPQSLYQIVSILQGDVERGTGRQARVPGHTIAGKTGTSNDTKDIWFVGFTHDLVCGVWMGFDTPHEMNGAGSYMAAQVFAKAMGVALADVPDRPFSVPDGIDFIRVNHASEIAATNDPNGIIITEAFKPGQKPNPPKRTESDGDRAAATVGGVF